MKLMRIYEDIISISGTNIEIDNRHGVGAVPHNQEIDYFGFETEMTPDEFLSLATHTDMNSKRIKNMWDILQRRGMGTPFLEAELIDKKDKSYWQVIGHEGRHRMAAIKQYGNPNIKIPVHIFPYKMRARDITPEMKLLPFKSQRER